MLLVQHIMTTIICKGFNIGYVVNNAANLVYVDAIRVFSKNRCISHFEKNYDRTDVSYWHLPEDYKVLTEGYIKEHINDWAHVAKDIKECEVGETTDLNTFELTNQHLPVPMFNCTKVHLIQDFVFDQFIRKYIDVSDRLEDIYYYDGIKYDGKGIRKIITDIENWCIYIMAYIIYKHAGIIVNQEWFDENIKRILYRDYTSEMAETTYGFMKIDEEINRLITDKDWSKLYEGSIPYHMVIDLINTIGIWMDDDRFVQVK